VVLFGRADATPDDIAYFKDNQLDSDTLAYHRTKLVESTDRPPRMVTSFERLFYDRVFQNRYLAPPQPHVNAAVRWLESTPDTRSFASPAQCLMAVREARTAVARRPDDPAAFRILADAYRLLMLHESAMLAGETLSSANYTRIVPQASILSVRFWQRMTALSYAIQTTPPPQTAEAKESLATLNVELGDLYLTANAIDLARERYQVGIELTDPKNINSELRLRMIQLDEQISDARTRMKALPDAAQADPAFKAQRALSLGLVGMAIDELYEADQSAVRVNVVRPMLLDLYCQTGQPDRATDILGSTEDPSLGTGPGTAAHRQGLVSYLIGSYGFTATLWQQRAIPELRAAQAGQALVTGQSLLKGEIRAATQGFLQLPNQVNTEAGWEAELGLCLLESGDPDRAAEHLTKAITLAPTAAIRPVLAYYLEKMGKPVPPVPKEVQATPAAAEPKETESSPDKPKTEERKPDVPTKPDKTEAPDKDIPKAP
jgi:tetratricopeptide (TPR) repeat protein